MNDRALVETIQRGEAPGREAFVELLDRFETKVYNVVYRTLPCRSDVDDVAQEAFIEIWKALPGFRFQSSLSTWIYRIAMNVTLEHVRRCRMRDEEMRDEDSIDSSLISDPSSNPVHETECAELKSVLDSALLRLPDEQRQVVVLHELNEMTYAEVAQVLDVPIGTVKSRLFHAMQKLKTMLEPYVNA